MVIVHSYVSLPEGKCSGWYFEIPLNVKPTSEDDEKIDGQIKNRLVNTQFQTRILSTCVGYGFV